MQIDSDARATSHIITPHVSCMANDSFSMHDGYMHIYAHFLNQLYIGADALMESESESDDLPSLVPRPHPVISMLHAEKREGLVSE